MSGPGDADDPIATASRLIDEGKAAEGIAILQASLTGDHRHVPTLIAYAEALRRFGALAYAEQAALMALEQEPCSIHAGLSLSRILHELGRTGEALERVEDLIAREPYREEAAVFRAGMLKSLGRFEAARALLQHVIERNPRSVLALSSLADIERFKTGSPLLEHMKALDAECGEDASFAPALQYALGKAHQDIGDHDRAFAHFARGAAVKRARIHYDEADMLRHFDETIAAFGADFLEGVEPRPEAATQPVFIVGMPRSGSTLIERILASHPAVRTEGERRSFSESLAEAAGGDAKEDAAAVAARMSDEAWRKLGALHRNHIEQEAGGAPILVNKLPGNLFLVATIRRALPEARFIVSARDPLDTCLSAFTTLFAYHVPWSYDLGELGRYHRGCERLITHWRSLLPEEALRLVRYEDLVADPEKEARALIDWLGLGWDPACLAFEHEATPVRTASAAQVRRPIHRGSVGRWRLYERHLAPLIEALGGGRAAA